LTGGFSYTKAIEVSVKADPVFYSNRAACEWNRHFLAVLGLTSTGYSNFEPKEWNNVVSDCDEAIKLDRM
jgi:import receptor subunit TOM70